MGALPEEDCKYFDEECSGDFSKYQAILNVSSHGASVVHEGHAGRGGCREVWFGTCAVYVRTCLSHRFVVVLTYVLRSGELGRGEKGTQKRTLSLRDVSAASLVSCLSAVKLHPVSERFPEGQQHY